MTDLLTRHPATRTGATPPVRRPLTVSAALAGLGAACGGLLVFMAIAVAGWYFADGGAHGDTPDALRVGADAWLVGHGSQLSFGGVTYTLVPLGVTALLAWVAFRAGRWAGSVSPPGDDREVLVAIGLFASSYVVVAVLTSVVASTSEVAGSLVLLLLGALVISGAFGGAGMVTGADRWPAVRRRLPIWAWPVVRSALAVILGFWACAAVLVAVSFAWHLNAAASLISRLDLSGGDALMLVLLTALLAPNAVLFGGAYLLGPGFAIGTGTVVSPGAVVLGPVPAFPLLAALPGDGPTPWFSTVLIGVPAVVAAVAVGMVQRRHPVLAWDLSALRGVGSGILAGFAAGILTGLGGGALGSGRMADIGAGTGSVIVAGALSMGVGGLIGALLVTYVQRRAGMRAEPGPEPAESPPANRPPLGGEPRVRPQPASRPSASRPSAPRQSSPRSSTPRDRDEDNEPTQPIALPRGEAESPGPPAG